MTDREPPYALCEINQSKQFDVVAVGFSAKLIVTMGGLNLAPDITIDDVNIAEAGIFILPGGDIWEQNSDEKLSFVNI